jgi:hypothetical protein
VTQIGRPIGRTADSELCLNPPFSLFFNDLRCAQLLKVAVFLVSLVKKSVKNCTKIGQLCELCFLREQTEHDPSEKAQHTKPSATH